MSAINVNSITGRTGSHGPVLTGVTTATNGLHITGGSVGIGTDNPQGALDVRGDDIRHQGLNPYITFHQSDGTNSGYLQSRSTELRLNSVGSIPLTLGTDDTERLRIDTSGRLLVGVTSSLGNNATLQTSGEQVNYQAFHHITAQAGPFIILSKSNGTQASPTAVLNADYLGLIGFSGYDGTDYLTRGAEIACQVDGTPGSNDMPGRLIFATTADGASSPTERMRIDSSGRLLVGTATTGGMNGGTIVAGDQLGTFGSVALAIKYTSTDTINTFGSAYSSANTVIGFGVRSDTTTVDKFLSTAGNASFKRGALQVGGELIYSNAAAQNTAVGSEVTLTERLRIDSSGNVGINESSPNAALHISSANDATIRLQNTDAGDNGVIQFSGTVAGTAEGQVLYNFASNYMRFYVNRDERMRIDSSGNAGIGTVSPQDKLHVHDGRIAISATATEGSDTVLGTLMFRNGSNNNRNAKINAYQEGGTSGAGLRFYTRTQGDATNNDGGEERMRLDSNGDFTIQTTSISQYTQTSGTGSWAYSVDTGTSRGTVIATNNADRGWAMMYMNKFSWTSSDDGRYINFYKNGAGVSSIELNTSGTVDYNTGSDYRLKENIVPMTNGITRIKQLLPKQFNMIDDPDDNLCDGFLAHEAQTVVPQAVCGTHNGMRIDEEGNEVPDYQGMDYGKLTPLLTAALQEAIAKIETLEAKVATLEGN